MVRLSGGRGYLPILECVGILVFVAILLLPDFWMAGGTDYGAYFNGGRLIINGLPPYTGFWEPKNPLLLFLLGGWQGIFGSSWWSAKAALLPIYGLFSISIYVFCSVVMQRRWLAITSALVGAYLVLRLDFDPGRNGSIIVFATSLELFSLAFLFRGLFGPQRISSFLIGGDLAACAFLARQTAVAPFIVAAVTLFFLGVKNRQSPRFREVIGSFFWFLAGALPIFLVIVIFMAVTSDLSEWYNQAFVFGRVYGSTYIASAGIQVWLKSWLSIASSDTLLWVLALGGIALYPRLSAISPSPPEAEPPVKFWFTYGCLGASLLCALATINVTRNYSLQYLPYLVITSMVALFDYIRLIFLSTIRAKAGLLIILIYFLLSATIFQIVIPSIHSLQTWYCTADYYEFNPRQMTDYAVAEELKSLCQPHDTVFTYPGRPWVNLLSNRNSPDRYYIGSGLFWKGYRTPDEFEAEMARLSKSPPKFVVVWGVSFGRNPFPVFYNGEYVKQFEEFVLSRYTLYKTMALEQTWPYVYAGDRPAVYIYLLKP